MVAVHLADVEEVDGGLSRCRSSTSASLGDSRSKKCENIPQARHAQTISTLKADAQVASAGSLAVLPAGGPAAPAASIFIATAILMLLAFVPVTGAYVNPHVVLPRSAIWWAAAGALAVAVEVVSAADEVEGSRWAVSSMAPNAMGHSVLLVAHFVAGLSDGW